MTGRTMTVTLDDYTTAKIDARAKAMGITPEELVKLIVDARSFNYDDFTWTYEKIAYYVYPADYTASPTVPVARFWSPTNQHHFYTASAEETAVVRTYPAAIWTFEGYNYRVPVG